MTNFWVNYKDRHIKINNQIYLLRSTLNQQDNQLLLLQ